MSQPQSRPISKKTLLTVSIIADVADLTGLGLWPGPWSLIIDVPVTAMHFMYAGPKALIVLTEYVPFVGFLPVYTIAALLYSDPQKQVKVIDVTPAPAKTSPPPLIIDVSPVVSASPPPLPALTQESTAKTEIAERLRKLEELFRQALITEVEYRAKRQQILGEI